MFSTIVSTFVLTFSTFVPVINPFSGAMVFSTMTSTLTDRDRGFVANRISMYSLVILLVCLSCGHLILSFFGISVGALRVAGGCVLFAAGWNALNAPTQRDTPHITGVILGTLATVVVIWACYRYSDRVSKAVGAAGADALARIFAFILICLGVAICWQGFSELWLGLEAQRR